jgi:hypothetical protein
MSPLNFECDGTLEVCGFTGFGPDDVMLRIDELTITQNGESMSPKLPIIAVAPATEWEGEIPNAKKPKGKLDDGPAIGAASGYLVKKGGGIQPVAWPGSLQLVDGCAILNEIEPELVPVWKKYLKSGRRYP